MNYDIYSQLVLAYVDTVMSIHSQLSIGIDMVSWFQVVWVNSVAKILNSEDRIISLEDTLKSW